MCTCPYISCHKKRKIKTNAEKRKTEEQKDEELNKELKNTVDVVDVEPNSEMETYFLSVVKALTLKDREVLLGITRSTKEGRLAHIRFPDIIGADVTYGDNAKKQRNKNILLVNAFLSSQQAYVFPCFLKKQFPPFWILKRC